MAEMGAKRLYRPFGEQKCGFSDPYSLKSNWKW